jgi:hypothetical protein
MLAEAFGLAHPAAAPRRAPGLPGEQFLVALQGQPLVRCAALAEAAEDGRRLNGLRCLGVARARFVRVFLTAAPGAIGLREAAGFAALVTALLREDPGGDDAGAAPVPPGPAGDDGRSPPREGAVPQGRGPVYRI